MADASKVKKKTGDEGCASSAGVKRSSVAALHGVLGAARSVATISTKGIPTSRRSKSAKSTRAARAAIGLGDSLGAMCHWGLPLGLTNADLNEKEQVVLQVVVDAGRVITLREIVGLVASPIFPSDMETRNSWVRNALRRLVREGFVQSSVTSAQLGRGEYAIGARAISSASKPQALGSRDQDPQAAAGEALG